MHDSWYNITMTNNEISKAVLADCRKTVLVDDSLVDVCICVPAKRDGYMDGTLSNAVNRAALMDAAMEVVEREGPKDADGTPRHTALDRFHFIVRGDAQCARLLIHAVFVLE